MDYFQKFFQTGGSDQSREAFAFYINLLSTAILLNADDGSSPVPGETTEDGPIYAIYQPDFHCDLISLTLAKRLFPSILKSLEKGKTRDLEVTLVWKCNGSIVRYQCRTHHQVSSSGLGDFEVLFCDTPGRSPLNGQPSPFITAQRQNILDHTTPLNGIGLLLDRDPNYRHNSDGSKLNSSEDPKLPSLETPPNGLVKNSCHSTTTVPKARGWDTTYGSASVSDITSLSSKGTADPDVYQKRSPKTTTVLTSPLDCATNYGSLTPILKETELDTVPKKLDPDSGIVLRGPLGDEPVSQGNPTTLRATTDLRPRDTIGEALGSLHEDESNNSDDELEFPEVYWTWDSDRENWFHQDDDGEIIWYPLEFD